MEKQVTAGPMLMPKYVSRFACTGGDCEDTCCSGWRIDLDRATLLRYEASEDPELQPLFQEFVKRNPANPTMQVFGHIQKLDGPCHYCPFLDESKLCRIQTRFGADWLCDTCSDFPRSAVQLGDFQQMTLQLSCPEAARLALLEPDAFELVADEASIRSGAMGRVDTSGGMPLEDMEEIRTQMFQILQTREVDISRRLAVLGLFCERLTELTQQGKFANLSGLVGAMDAYIEDAASQIPLKPVHEREFARAKFAWIFLLTMHVSALPPHQRRVVDAVASGLGIPADGVFDEASLRRGIQAGTGRLDVALEAAPLLLEHYLLNEAMREVLPWSNTNPFQHFIHFLLRFAILRVMLVGRAAAQETILTPKELAETVQVFCRRMQNGKKIVDQINPEVIEGDWTSLKTLFTVV
jgi:lysine-N-methylase